MRTDSVKSRKKKAPVTVTLNRGTELLHIDDKTIREVARRKLGGDNIAAIVVRQACTEGWMRFRKKIRFRFNQNRAACQGYCAMRPTEFEQVNSRQSWANWRTIPRNLNGRIANRPVKGIDLCCGTGASTAVLAYYLAPGSELLGLEYNPQFVELAQRRAYDNDRGLPVRVGFRAQSVLETFRDQSGAAIPSHSIDLVNSSGAVGCHFDPQATRVLAQEISRVLKPGGLALIDSGADGTKTREVVQIFTAVGFQKLHAAKSCALDRYTQVCFRLS